MGGGGHAVTLYIVCSLQRGKTLIQGLLDYAIGGLLGYVQNILSKRLWRLCGLLVFAIIESSPTTQCLTVAFMFGGGIFAPCYICVLSMPQYLNCGVQEMHTHKHTTRKWYTEKKLYSTMGGILGLQLCLCMWLGRVKKSNVSRLYQRSRAERKQYPWGGALVVSVNMYFWNTHTGVNMEV